MTNTIKNKSAQSVRYTDVQKKEVVDFVVDFNAAKGRGGQSAAVAKFKISPITVGAWLKAAAVGKASNKAVAKAPKAAKADGGRKVGTRYTAEQKKEVTDFVASHNVANRRGGQSAAAAKFGISPLTVMAWLKASGDQKAPKKEGKDVKSVAPKKAEKARKTAEAAPDSEAPITTGGNAKLESLLTLSAEIVRAQAELAKLHARFASISASI